MAWLAAAASVVLLAAPAAQASPSLPGSPARPTSAAGSATASALEETPLDVVILVDESGSETAASIHNEAEAASTIAQTALNPRSRVTVVGFAGADGVAPDQVPTTEVCPPTIVGAPGNSEALARCVGKLAPRTPEQGDNTDYAAALSQAMSVLAPGTALGQQSPAGAIKVILMMTDGGLSVPGDPSYPQPDWLPAARHDVKVELNAARNAGVEVWPLGFGSIDRANADYLQYMASQGAQQGCDARPHAVIAQNSFAALSAFSSLYAAAACIGTSTGGSATLLGGQTRKLSVTVPAIASSVAIGVNKGSPGVTVDYITPGGVTDPTGTVDGASYSRSGQDTAVDVLRVTNPPPGTWQIKLTAPPGLHSELVSATAFWQGAARVSILPSPPNAQPGQRISMTLSVLGRNGPLTGLSSLAGVQVRATESGDGMTTPVVIPLSQVSPAAGLGAGNYTGSVTAPSRTGTLTLTGTVAALGLNATKAVTQVSVSNQKAALSATVGFNGPDTVTAGQDLGGTLQFSNQTGHSQQVRLELAASGALATVKSPAGVLTVPSGTSTRPFSIGVASGSRAGLAQLTVTVVSAGRSATQFGALPFTVTVRRPPGFFAKYLLIILGVIVLVLLGVAVALLRRAVRRRRIDVRGLRARLLRDGVQLGPDLTAPGKWADTFRFVIREDPQPGREPRLDHPQSGEQAYSARRLDRGSVTVRTPAGAKLDRILVGGQAEALPRDGSLALAFFDRALTGVPTGPRPEEPMTSSGGAPGSDSAPDRESAPGTAGPGSQTSQRDNFW
jgi:hypothetical protein